MFTGSLGSLSPKNKVATLASIGKLTKIKELRLLNLSVDADGILPLASCTSLDVLELSNQFETQEYAYLSVKLRNTKCDYFKATVLAKIINANSNLKKDTMVIGKRKPFLLAKTDQAQIKK